MTTKAEPPAIIETEISRVADQMIEQTRATTAFELSAKAKRLRDRAEECRALARMMTSADHAAVYLNHAETYERLAEQAEWLARDIVTFQHPNVRLVG